MKRLLKLGLVVPATLALVFVGFSVAYADQNADNNSELNQDLNRDLNDNAAPATQDAVVTASDGSGSDDSGQVASTDTQSGRPAVDRRGRTPGKTSVTQAAGQDRWWWGGGWGGHHGGGGWSNSNDENDDENDDEDDDEGPDENGETQTNP